MHIFNSEICFFYLLSYIPIYTYDDDVYFKKITTRVSQNLILHRNADQPKAQARESTYKYNMNTYIYVYACE
jgi:hypothetical protein